MHASVQARTHDATIAFSLMYTVCVCVCVRMCVVMHVDIRNLPQSLFRLVIEAGSLSARIIG